MTQRPADVPTLPLSVTCTADEVFAGAIGAVVSRFAGGPTAAGGGDVPLSGGARTFTEAVQAGVAACLSHVGSSGRDLSVTLSSEATHWVGVLRWPATDDETGALAAIEATLSSVADAVVCGHDGADAHCELRCRRD